MGAAEGASLIEEKGAKKGVKGGARSVQRLVPLVTHIRDAEAFKSPAMEQILEVRKGHCRCEWVNG